MEPWLFTVLVCTLCVAGIGAIYFVWKRKTTQAQQPSQPGPQ